MQKPAKARLIVRSDQIAGLSSSQIGMFRIEPMTAQPLDGHILHDIFRLTGHKILPSHYILLHYELPYFSPLCVAPEYSRQLSDECHTTSY
jgi:hypothetical protein